MTSARARAGSAAQALMVQSGSYKRSAAAGPRPVRRPVRPVECGHRRDVAARIGDCAAAPPLNSSGAEGKTPPACVDMRLEEVVALFEDVEGRAGTGIDLDEDEASPATRKSKLLRPMRPTAAARRAAASTSAFRFARADPAGRTQPPKRKGSPAAGAGH